MKKLLGICICLLLICAAIVPTVAFAADEGNVAKDIIYFLNPTALTTMDGYLFVADRIEDNRSAIICFDLTQDSPVHVATFMVPEKVNNISDNGSNKLYVIAENKVLEMDWDKSQHTLTNTEKVYRIADNSKINDFAYGVFGLGEHTEYYLTNEHLWRNDNGTAVTATTANFDSSVACYALDKYVYYIYTTNNVTYCRRYDGELYTTEMSSDKFNTELTLSDIKPLGFFEFESTIAIFGSKSIVSVTADSNSCVTKTIMANYGEMDDKIVDASATIGKICVLNNRNVVEIYQNDTDGLKKIDTIGSDTLKQPVPTEYTSFTLVRSKGYPANIVFKTEGENSIDALEIITDMENTTFIVLGYDGDENSNFYYVLLGDKFGWVKKSENASSVEEDTDRLEIINTDVSDDNFTTKAKFISQNAVYVSPLPRQFFYDNENYRKVYTQSSSNRINVTVLQKFTEGNTTWYYVSFEVNGETHKGFVPQSAIGQFNISGSVEGVSVVGLRKINSALFSTVKVYDESMTESAYDSNGNQIKPLSSGTRILLISEENGVAFIQIVESGAFGYVYTSDLIGLSQVTTNAAVGITFLALAVALAVAMTVVIVKRRRGKQATAPTSKGN